MTFFEVLDAAEKAPALDRLAAEVEVAEASLVTAGTFAHNPVVEVEAADRSNAGGSTTDRGIGVSQTFEVGGQRGKRRAAAALSLHAARAQFDHARRMLRVEAAVAFARIVHRRELWTVAQAEAELARSFTTLTERRLEAGAATAVESALAQAGLGRSERGLALARGDYRVAQARLAELVALPEAVYVEPAGELPQLAAAPTIESLLEAALRERGDLRSAHARLEAAEAHLLLAEALRMPDFTVGLRAATEEGDDLTGISVAVPLPFFNRNQGEIATAEAEVVAARSTLATQELAVRREVAAAVARLEAALDARGLARRSGLIPLAEGLRLLERSFEAGKIGTVELLLYRRELVEGERQAVEADGEAWEALLELVRVAGHSLPGLEWAEPGWTNANTKQAEPVEEESR